MSPENGRPPQGGAGGNQTAGQRVTDTVAADAEVLAEIDIDERVLATLDTAGIAGAGRVVLAVDDNGLINVDVLRARSGLVWLAEELAAVLLATWAAELINANPALDTYLRGQLAEVPALSMTSEPVARALLTAAQAGAA